MTENIRYVDEYMRQGRNVLIRLASIRARHLADPATELGFGV